MTAASLEATALTPRGHQVALLAAKPVNVIGNIEWVGRQVQNHQIDWTYLR